MIQHWRGIYHSTPMFMYSVLLHAAFEPEVVAVFGVGGGPVFVYGGQEGFLGGGDDVVDFIGGGGGTGVVKPQVMRTGQVRWRAKFTTS